MFATASSNRALFGGVACVALTALLVALGAGQIRSREAAGGTDFALEVPDADMFPTEADGGQDDIPMMAPPGQTAPEDVPSQRTQPAGARDGAAQPAAPAAEAVGETAAGQSDQAGRTTPSFNAKTVTAPGAAAAATAFARPIVLAAGRFSVGGKVLELDGIVPIAVNRQCTDSAGEGWPCGRMARTAFANLVRGRTIDCDVPSRQWSGTAQARCTLAGKDLSRWLSENGWAEAAGGSPYEAAAEAARQAGLGLHNPDPRGTAARSRDLQGTNIDLAPDPGRQQQQP